MDGLQHQETLIHRPILVFEFGLWFDVGKIWFGLEHDILSVNPYVVNMLTHTHTKKGTV